ncbi:MAG: DNA recombination protein RmuC [Pseudomonadota bacterium]
MKRSNPSFYDALFYWIAAKATPSRNDEKRVMQRSFVWNNYTCEYDMEITTILLLVAAIALGFSAGWALFSRKRISLATRLEISQQELDSLRDDLEFARSERTQFHEKYITAETKRELLEKELEQTQEKLRAEFKNTATNIFEDFSNKFTVQSEKKIGDLLNPLRDRLGEFQKKIDDSFSAQGKEQHSLKAEIEKIVLQTDGLTRALRGDVKAQGNWGEVMLERILEESGLRTGEDYIIQGTGMGLNNADGGRLQPDVIVNLPDKKHIIIDSKVSLTAYERYCNEGDETLRQIQIKEFVRSIKAHVNGLEQKRYQDIEKLGTPDFVMMFLPIEGAYSLAIQADSELHSYAWGKKIVLVCPATLFATLRTIASIWRIERQNVNAQEIARQGGALYDKFSGFLGDMEEINKHIHNLHKAYDNANNKLVSGRGNILNQVEKLKILGAKTSKSLPKSREANLEEDIEELMED